MKKLVKDNLLKYLDLIDFKVCIDCIKEKWTIHIRKNITRSKELYHIIDIDICESLHISYFNEEMYFITFIYHISRYDYVYLIYKKSQSVDTLKIYINEVQR